jgi:hypothetical protein
MASSSEEGLATDCFGALAESVGLAGSDIAGVATDGALGPLGAVPPKDHDAREPASSSSVIPTTPAPGRTNRHIADPPTHTRAC